MEAETADLEEVESHFETVEGQQEPVSFVRPLENVEATVNETVTLSCELSQPGEDVMWMKNNEPLSIADTEYQIVNRDFTYELTIPRVTQEDGGEYSVNVGDLRSSAVLAVTGGFSTYDWGYH